LDLIPSISIVLAVNKITQDRGKQSMANHLRKQLGISGVKAGLLREIVVATDFNNAEKLCALMKSLPIKLVAARPISEAISTAGGIEFTELDHNLMLVKKPGVFCAGEMLDWEAPTGGYLLTACLSLGRAAGMGVIASLE
jgi:predicted flavoprotein YhiN